MATGRDILKKWFSNFKRPTQEQFWEWIDSFWHKNEEIPMASVQGLEKSLEKVATSEQLNNHESDLQAHSNLLAQKVDKETGKGLSSNDFTDVYKQKIDDFQLPDLSPYLQRGNYNGTAQDLKQFIDNINTVLQSNDSTLDDLQEIVNYIKQNKQILSTLGISNIAGLVDALASKSDTNHTHSEYALDSHTHSWDNIENKPTNLATTQNITDAISGIKMSGRNLLRNTLNPNLQNWKHSDNTSIESGQLDVFGGTDAFRLRINNNDDFYFSTIAGNVYAVKTKGKYTVSFYAKSSTPINMPVTVSGVVKSVDITSEWKKYDIIFDVQSPTSYKDLEFAGSYSLTGNMGLELYFSHIKLVKEHEDWSPAIEDIYQQIDDIKIGGRNLLKNSIVNETSTEYGFAVRTINLQAGETYTFSVNGRCNNVSEGKQLTACLYLEGWSWSVDVSTTSTEDKTSYVTFVAPKSDVYWIRSYYYPISEPRLGNVTTNWYKVEKGNKPTDYTPAPEDFYNEINTNVLKINTSVRTSQKINGYSQNGRNIVSTSGTDITVTVDSSDGFCATYQKMGTGNIIFANTPDKAFTLVDNTNTINGTKGSTATITVVDNEILLRISNV